MLQSSDVFHLIDTCVTASNPYRLQAVTIMDLPIIEVLKQIAKDQAIKVQVNGVTVWEIHAWNQPIPAADGLHITYRQKVGKHSSERTKTIAYPDGRFRSLLRGDWSDFGEVRAKANRHRLLPRVFCEPGSDVSVRWDSPIQIKVSYPIASLLTYRLHGFDIIGAKLQLRLTGLGSRFIPPIDLR